ncbi:MULTISPECIES: methionine ABC transporter ATP-binding protein [Lysinibacillus]|uniref:Methionine ABC transporter ATP-binding protein n=2 Tax=Lysinibacillus TaxID=400634 RepID=A0A2I0UVZ9_9BACI|nr:MULTISPECIES: methionine ABC transporter ATP-binding protein [Lysinibacillus]KUF27643.1 phosphate ABC transporter ATP-binding protein [Lysinibacillus sp. F5]MEE3808868.1 methionine ABC transporter ATP-binding protein [Lysinibacillus fusiformis]PKU50186.1 methionine ABC transporter ATP-binding protein [Lysinibacillus fusiformis]WCH48008.1 methionine ABC transporter ATP-binding protein [Lysinibacillus sp. OF-1]
MIEFQNVAKTFKFGDREVNAVKDVSLSIQQGEIFGIIGFSGAGKSTLLRLVNLLESPTHGTVQVQGVDINSLTPKEVRKLRRRIGMIFQNFNLFSSRTVAGNVAYPLKLAGVPKKEINERVAELLSFVGLTEKANDYPEQLSGGQKQRVGIARALATSPDILICDEATSALDPDTTGEILRLLKKVNKDLGITILLITHEMNVIQQICDRVAVMENGAVIESNSVFDIFTNPQHLTTQRFIQSVQQDRPSASLLEEWRKKGGKNLYRVIFKGDIASDPILSRVTRKFDVDVNIVYGSVREIQEKFYGNLLVSFEGHSDKIPSVLTELQDIVTVEEVKFNEG